VFPGKRGFAARAIRDGADVKEVIELMRLNYDGIVAREGSLRSSRTCERPRAGAAEFGYVQTRVVTDLVAR
jgi:hypothetical protein